MYAVSSRRTEAGMKIRIPVEQDNVPTQPVISPKLAEMRRISREWAAKHDTRRRVDETLRRQREEANALIAKGRKASQLFQGRDDERFHIGYEEIERRALKVFKTTSAELRSDRRNKEIVLARQFVIYWAARLTKLSYPAIGRFMGGRDHTTILHAKRAYPAKRAAMGRHLREVR
ncbi:helix-turn-helix domain-containing protein [Corticibacterium sp. UT-5YL-CI-8]|nr:helix-turn-helix domain-containing protein [Tianweitania sp. UT-5YL-CI-8]